MEETIERDIISFILKTALSFQGGTHVHIAKLVHTLFSKDFISTLENNKLVLYRKKDTTYEKVPHLDLVRNELLDPVAKYIDTARYALQGPEGNDPEYEDKMKKYKESMKKILKMQENCYNMTFRNSVLKEALVLFHDPSF